MGRCFTRFDNHPWYEGWAPSVGGVGSCQSFPHKVALDRCVAGRLSSYAIDGNSCLTLMTFQLAFH